MCGMVGCRRTNLCLKCLIDVDKALSFNYSYYVMTTNLSVKKEWWKTVVIGLAIVVLPSAAVWGYLSIQQAQEASAAISEKGIVLGKQYKLKRYGVAFRKPKQLLTFTEKHNMSSSASATYVRDLIAEGEAVIISTAKPIKAYSSDIIIIEYNGNELYTLLEFFPSKKK